MVKKSSAAAEVGCIRVTYLQAEPNLVAQQLSWSFHHAIASIAELTPSAADKFKEIWIIEDLLYTILVV